jgi:hypothetical protein
MYYPNDLGATANNSYILSIYDGLCDRRFLVSRPTNKRRSKKITYTRSALPVNPITHKISIRKINKIKRRRSRIPNPKFKCVFEIHENSLNCCPM